MAKEVAEFTPARIVKLRRKLGMNQRDFADYLGVGRATIARWETDRFHPSKHLAEKLARAEEEVNGRRNGRKTDSTPRGRVA